MLVIYTELLDAESNFFHLVFTFLGTLTPFFVQIEFSLLLLYVSLNKLLIPGPQADGSGQRGKEFSIFLI